MNDYSFTLTVRPMAVVKAFAVAVLSLFLLVKPATTSQASDIVPPRVPSAAEVARARAIAIVDRAIVSIAKTPVSDDVRKQLVPAIVDFSVENQLDPLFVVALIQNESGFDPRIRSIRCKEPGVESTCYLNAQGLMQIIPSTERAEIKRRGLGPKDMLDPIDNVDIGVGYVGYLGRGFKRVSSILWAYNQGPGVAMARSKNQMPDGWTQERWDKAVAEGAAFETNVLSTYRKLLGDIGIKADYRKMNALFRSPDQTVFLSQAGQAPVVAQR